MQTKADGRALRRIEDYALIGDLETAALVHRDLSIDWLCWPRFDSPACFAELVGSRGNGRWTLESSDPPQRFTRKYLGHSLILETRIETAHGVAVVCDFMPPQAKPSQVVRMVRAERGVVRLRSVVDIRLDYGTRAPLWTREGPMVATAVAGAHAAQLTATVSLELLEEDICVAEFTVEPERSVSFCLGYFESFRKPTIVFDPERALQETQRFWADWVSRCSYQGKWREPVLRSLITMKALTYIPSGGILAAPTSSLPEWPGGSRNWDYRFCWLRDATFSLLAFLHTGYRDEALAWRRWLLRVLGGNPDNVQPLYGVGGESHLVEWQAHWLNGFNGARPVRFGNAAYSQLQLDVYGELVDALRQARLRGIPLDESVWKLQLRLIAHLEKIWCEPDHGIWESRGQPKRFTLSRAMVWAALDRTIRRAEAESGDPSLEHWRRLRTQVHEATCEQGFNRQRNSFVRDFAASELDSSLLLLPQIGFLPPDDPRIQGTLQAVSTELMRDGLLLRYDPRVLGDGESSGESAFIACSFWYADALSLSGRHEEAVEVFERVLSVRNDVGLLSEEYDTHAGCMTGNFPQTLSHVTLVNTALNLSQESGPARTRSGLVAPAPQ